MKEKQAEFTKWMGPILQALRNLGGTAKPREVSIQIIKDLKLPENIIDEPMKSGGSKFKNQVAWARQYLVWEGCLDSSIRGIWSLTLKGQATLLTNEQSRKIFLKWVDIFQKARKNKDNKDISSIQDEETPENLEHSIKPNLLEVLKSISWKGFEFVCKRLLLEHEFENVEVTGSSHD